MSLSDMAMAGTVIKSTGKKTIICGMAIDSITVNNLALSVSYIYG